MTVRANIDLKLLTIVDELYRTRSVSQTAENVGLNQSAISMSLARLRKHFNDPLFVRTNGGMEPTPHAAEIIKLLRQAHGLLQLAIDHHVIFEPATSTRTFRICATDIGQVVVLPSLMNRLREVAPFINIDLRNLSEDTSRQMESGDIDLAFGFIQGLNTGFYQQTLFKERFVCVARADHPRIGDSLSLDQLQSELHLVVTTISTGHGIIEKTLAEKRIQRKVGLRVPNFLDLSALVSSTDLLAIVPERFGHALTTRGSIKVLTLPITVPSYSVTQHWHERFDRDPGIRWLRTLIADLFPKKQALNGEALARRSSTVTPMSD